MMCNARRSSSLSLLLGLCVVVSSATAAAQSEPAQPEVTEAEVGQSPVPAETSESESTEEADAHLAEKTDESEGMATESGELPAPDNAALDSSTQDNARALPDDAAAPLETNAVEAATPTEPVEVAPAEEPSGEVESDQKSSEETPLVGYFGPAWLPGRAEVRGPWVPGIEEVGIGLFSTLAPTPSRWLADNGFQFFGWYMFSNQGLVSGGLQQGFASSSLFDFGMNVDLGTLANWDGLLFHLSGSLATGPNLTTDVGAAIQVNAVYSGTAMRFFEAYLEYNTPGEELSLRAGRLTPGWEYGLDYDITTQYLSAAFRLNVFSLDANDPNFSVIPYANWGARARYTPNENFRVQASFMNGYPRDFADPDNHGADFSFQPGKGSFFLLESTYQWLATEGARERSDGMPGQITAGGYYDTGEFDYIDGSGRSAQGLGTAYVIARQKVWEPAPDSPLGIKLWSSLTWSGSKNIVSFPFYVNGGLVWNGIIEGRESDSFAFGVASADFGPGFDTIRNETVLEWAYTVHVNGFVDITPDFQYILNPGGTGTIPDAVIAGALCYFTL